MAFIKKISSEARGICLFSLRKILWCPNRVFLNFTS
nr:MAG TPA: hypothetical protein [Caudoviricetes sp.]